MSRILPIDVEQANGKTKDLLSAVQKSLGTVPNLFKVAAQSPAVIDGLLSFSRALKASKLTAKEREQIALLVAGQNNCDYCLAAHSTLGQMVGLNEQEIVNSVKAEGEGERIKAILNFAKAVTEKRGQISSSDYEQLTEAHVSQEEALEIVAVVVENILTNYINNVAETEVDFKLPDSVRDAKAKTTSCAR